jgi:hypothetical protein
MHNGHVKGGIYKHRLRPAYDNKNRWKGYKAHISVNGNQQEF